MENHVLIVTMQLGDEDVHAWSIVDDGTNLLETLVDKRLLRKIYNHKSWQKSDEYHNKKIDIIIPPEMNLGHQCWNQFCGGLIGASYISAKHPNLNFRFTHSRNTNYFPAEILARQFNTESKFLNFKDGLYFAGDLTLYFDSKKPLYDLCRPLIANFCPGHNDKINSDIIIFSIKAGGTSFSNIQFPIEEAIAITSLTIKALNLESQKSYQFIIDGTTLPYIPEVLQKPETEPEQRRRFKESEDYWFGKLKEKLAGIELTFINGMNLVEKYTYYKAASKFIRFGTGSYHMVWQTLKKSNPSNQLGLLVENSEYRRPQLRKNTDYATLLPHQNCEDSTNLIVDFITRASNQPIKKI